jgi:hypothetical protein
VGFPPAELKEPGMTHEILLLALDPEGKMKNKKTFKRTPKPRL